MRRIKVIIAAFLMLAMTAGMFAALGGEKAQAATKPAKAKVTAKANDDGTSVTLTIAKTKNAQGYKIMVKKPGAKKFTKLVTIKEDGTAKRTYTAKKLTEGEYQFKVRAYLKNGKKTVWGKYSKVAKVKVEKPATEDTGKDDKEQKTGNRKTVTFGKFEQDNDTSNGAEPIEWIVLKDDGEKMLLLSKYILDFRFFNDLDYSQKESHFRWEDTSTRKWLNGEFFNTSFSEEEQERIIEVENVTYEDPSFGLYGYPAKDEYPEGYYKGSVTTKDKVFLLSIEDVLNPEYGLVPAGTTYESFTNSMGWMTNLEQRLKEVAELRATYTKYAEYTAGIITDNGVGESAYSEASVEALIKKVQQNAEYFGYGDYTWSWWLRTPGTRKRVDYTISPAGGLSKQFDQTTHGTRPAIWITK